MEQTKDTLLLELVERLADRLRIVEPAEASGTGLVRRASDRPSVTDQGRCTTFWMNTFCVLQLVENRKGEHKDHRLPEEGDCLVMNAMRPRGTELQSPPAAAGAAKPLRLYREKDESPRGFVRRMEENIRRQAPYVRIADAPELAGVPVDF